MKNRLWYHPSPVFIFTWKTPRGMLLRCLIGGGLPPGGEQTGWSERPPLPPSVFLKRTLLITVMVCASGHNKWKNRIMRRMDGAWDTFSSTPYRTFVVHSDGGRAAWSPPWPLSVSIAFKPRVLGASHRPHCYTSCEVLNIAPTPLVTARLFPKRVWFAATSMANLVVNDIEQANMWTCHLAYNTAPSTVLQRQKCGQTGSGFSRSFE